MHEHFRCQHRVGLSVGAQTGPRRRITLSGMSRRMACPMLTNAELARLHVRVIALENLVIALLAARTDEEREMACVMADYISPRPGYTRHPLTIHAAAQMVHLVQRARRWHRCTPEGGLVP
jgi:hypothetical protein